MNYYIQGSANRAEEIKAAFEILGYYSAFEFNVEATLYFTFNGEVKTATAAGPIKSILKTHPDYQKLELPAEPKFKVGDKVIYNGKQHTVTFVNDKYYGFSGGVAGCLIELQDQLLSPAPKPHYDIANFYAGMPVLVREYDTCVWQWVLYSHFNGVGLFFAAGKTWRQCIPFEGNEHLLGTTDMPDECYINW